MTFPVPQFKLPVGYIFDGLWVGDIETIPKGWIPCFGQSLKVSDYPELFDVIEYGYGGSGDYFNVPDFRLTMFADPKPNNVQGPPFVLGFHIMRADEISP